MGRSGMGRKDPRGGPRTVKKRAGRPGTGRETLGEVLGLVWEVRDGSVDTRRGLGRVKGPSRRSGTGRGTLGEVRTGRGLLGRFRTVRGTLWEVRDGSWDDRRSSKRIGDSWVGPGRVGDNRGGSELV